MSGQATSAHSATKELVLSTEVSKEMSGLILQHARQAWGYDLQLPDIHFEGPLGTRDDYLTLNLKNGRVRTGCFEGTLAEFELQMELVYTSSIEWVHNDARDIVYKKRLREGYREAIVHFKQKWEEQQAKNAA